MTHPKQEGGQASLFRLCICHSGLSMRLVKREIRARPALLRAGRGGLGLVHFKALERAQRAIAGSGIRRPAAGGQRLHAQQGNG